MLQGRTKVVQGARVVQVMMVQRLRVVVTGVKVGGDVMYEGSSILGISVMKGVI